MYKYFAIYKPFGMLSQFTPGGGYATLGDLYDFDKDIYPVGRLDTDSEGLLLLTNDRSLNQKLLHPQRKVAKTYLAQVEKTISPQALNDLKKGITIRVKKHDHFAKAVKANQIDAPTWLPERIPPIRHRKNVPTSWLEVAITEGKNRQVRKMTAMVGFPTLRLVRIAIGHLSIGVLKGKTVKELNISDIKKALE